MGAWGFESCSSDGCWDLLGDCQIDNIHKMTQAEVDNACDLLMSVGPLGWADDYPQDWIGAVVWFLNHNMVVREDVLEYAVKITDILLDDEKHCLEYSEPASRKECLLGEKKKFQYALEHGGKTWEEHVPGLFEKLFSSSGIIKLQAKK